MNNLLIISGPTATGKTDLALSLAKKFNGELISADSRQVFRGMDIGTGKDINPNEPFHESDPCHPGPACAGRPDPGSIQYSTCLAQDSKKKNVHIGFRKKEGIPIWLVDMVAPDYSFHVSDYVHAARIAITDIQQRGKLPILVGGTGFYIRSLLHPPATLHVPDNPQLRSRLEALDVLSLQKELQHIQPQKWEQMNYSDKQNPRRLIRAIEVGEAVRKEPSSPEKGLSFSDTLWLGLNAPLPELYDRINARVEKRYQEGVVEEIRELLAKGYPWNLPSFSGCGYDIWKPFIEGQAPASVVLAAWKHQEHLYAKRQLTWFKKEKDIVWFNISAPGYQEKISQLVGTWYTKKGI